MLKIKSKNTCTTFSVSNSLTNRKIQVTYLLTPSYLLILRHFSLSSISILSENVKETFRFLAFSGGIEMKHEARMSYVLNAALNLLKLGRNKYKMKETD